MIKNEKSLMNKTKKELISIIDKQDDEITELKCKDKAMDENYSILMQKSNSLNDKLRISEENLKKAAETINKANDNVYQHQRGMDKIASEKAELTELNNKLNKKIKANNRLCWFLTIVIIVLLAIIIF